MWLNIQFLRAVAVYIVVLYHIFDSWNHYVGAHFAMPIHSLFGTVAVDIFFIISGFVMVETTRGRPITPKTFLVKRLMRVIPFYWFFTLGAVAIIMAGFSLFGNDGVSLRDILSSMLFLPNFDAAGKLRDPIIFVGWTLNYEMLFYLIFAISLYFQSVKTRIISISAFFVALTVLAQITENQTLLYFSHQRIWEFVLGMLIAAALPSIRALPAQTNLRAGIALIAVSSIWLVSTEIYEPATVIANKLFFLGFAGAGIVVGVIMLEAAGKRISSPFVLLQGDASFSTYLSHAFVLQLAGKVMIVTGINATIAGTVIGFSVTAIVIGVIGTLIYWTLEKPMSEQGKRLLEARA